MVVSKQKLAEKKSENEMVKNEFDILEEDANIFKMVGPIMVKQTLFECKDVVGQRVAFIDKEVARLEHLETEHQNKIQEKTNNIKKMQSDFQRLVMQA